MSILASLTSGSSASASHVTSKAEIESLFSKIMSPIKKEADPNLVAQMCSKVNADFDGAQIAVDLITSKLHSNQEWEILISLYVLEACVKNCGDRFHDLIGRFRFLNEMIKLVSPKYFGNRTSDKVKKRCIELLYCWSEGLPLKTKIREAYEMLKKQGIVESDPLYVEKLVINVAPRPKNAVFDNEEKSRQLAQLLKSKNPQDLEAANRLIKNMVRQDEIKIEKQSTRINELELMNNNVKLLNDMLLNYNQKLSSESEKETIKYLYEELQKNRPNLVKLANESEDNDDSIGEIIKTNEQCERIIGQYKLTFLNERGSSVHDDKLVNINEDDSSSLEISPSSESFVSPSSSTNKQSSSNKQSKSAAGTANSANYDPLKELQDLFSHEPAVTATSQMQKNDFNAFMLSQASDQSQFTQFTSDSLSANAATNNIESLLSSISVSGGGGQNQFRPVNQNNAFVEPNKKTVTKTPQLRALDDLNELGRNLMEKSLNDPKTPLTAAVASSTSNSLLSSSTSQQNITNLSLNDLQQIKISSTASPQHQQGDESTLALFNALNSLVVQLESIKPGQLAPFTLYEKNNLKVVLHFGRDAPIPDVNVVVISVTSANTQSVLRNFSFQAAVPKSMKLKLQPASRTDLPVFNPILAPSVITQVMLVANPRREQIRLKYKISYSYDDVNYNEMEEVKTLPILDSLL